MDEPDRIEAGPGSSESPEPDIEVSEPEAGLSDEAVLACVLSAKHLLNALRSIGINPADFETQEDAYDMVWPTRWAYDAWCAWHACRIVARKAGWDLEEIAEDRRASWRTSGTYVEGRSIIGPDPPS